jgi:hypothetical protein
MPVLLDDPFASPEAKERNLSFSTIAFGPVHVPEMDPKGNALARYLFAPDRFRQTETVMSAGRSLRA